jgi:hypothetical protein
VAHEGRGRKDRKGRSIKIGRKITRKGVDEEGEREGEETKQSRWKLNQGTLKVQNGKQIRVGVR